MPQVLLVILSYLFVQVFSPNLALADTSPPPLAISAVQITGGTGRTSADFIELLNYGPNAVNLNNFKLVKRTAHSNTNTVIYQWSEDFIVPAYHYALWANSDIASSINADVQNSNTIADNNAIGLVDNNNQLVSKLGFGEHTTDWGSQAANPTANMSVTLTNTIDNHGLIGDTAYTTSPSNPRSLNSPAVYIPETTTPENPIDTTATTPPNQPENPSITPNPELVIESPPDNSDPATTPAPTDNPNPVEPTTVTPTDNPTTTDTPTNEADISSNVSTSNNSNTTSTISSESPETTTNTTTNLPLQITEVLANPVGDDSGHEQFELYNPNQNSVTYSSLIAIDNASAGYQATSRFIINNLTLSSGEYSAITIPSGKFALNNTTADQLRIFLPNGELLDSVNLPAPAPEGRSYQKFLAGWSYADPTLGSPNETSPPPVENPVTVNITESQFSLDQDPGVFWVELYNTATQTSNLKNYQWIITDQKPGSRASSIAVPINQDFLIPAQSYAVMQLNISSDTNLPEMGNISLADTNEHSIAIAPYRLTDISASYALDSNSTWRFATPTPAAANNFNLPGQNLILSEIYPRPSKGLAEYIELFNAGNKPVQISLFQIQIGTKLTQLPRYTLPAGASVAITKDDIPFTLANDQGQVSLIDPYNAISDSTTYSGGQIGQSWSRLSGGWQWTNLPTPDEPNVQLTAQTTNTNLTTINLNSNDQTNLSSQSLGSIRSAVTQAVVGKKKSTTTTKKATATKPAPIKTVKTDDKTKVPETNNPNSKPIPFWAWVGAGSTLMGGLVFSTWKRPEKNPEQQIH